LTGRTIENLTRDFDSHSSAQLQATAQVMTTATEAADLKKVVERFLQDVRSA